MLIRFYVDTYYIWDYQLGSSRSKALADLSQFTTALKAFAEENKCLIDTKYNNVFYCSEDDYIMLKLKHPGIMLPHG